MTIPYPYLPADREILYVPAENQFMLEAKKMQAASTDAKNPIGIVMVKDGQIVARASNMSKLINPKLIKLHSKYCARRILKVPSGKGYWLCPGCATSKQHSESRLMAEAKKNKIKTEGADVYMYGHWWCCKSCWNAMIKGGIKNVYLVEKAWELFKR
jgi:deoxycytidylate deaminase